MRANKHCAAAVVALALMPVAAGVYAQDANALLAKYISKIQHSNTYTIDEQTVINVPGNGGPMTMNTSTSTMPVAGKVHVKATAGGNNIGPMAAAAARANVTLVDDGAQVFVYMPALNAYAKMPHVGLRAAARSIPALILPPNSKLKTTGTATVDGHVTVVAKLVVAGMGGGNSMVFYLDRVTGQPVRVVVSSDIPASPQNKNRGTMTATVRVLREAFNTPLADSLFHFTPPPGAHLNTMVPKAAQRK